VTARPPLRLALFGGAFDPIHNGHLAVARAAAARFRLDRLLFVPAARPPHKPACHAPYADRVRMIEIAVEEERDARFAVSLLEDGAGPSYSIDTIEKVRAEMPDGELFFLIGADAFADIRSWRRWREVARAVVFLVVSRPGHLYEIPPETRVERLDTVELPVSSSEIRPKLAAGKQDAGELLLDVPLRVLGYIASRHLYTGL
jgi:nicotinate-nucleotide adenylyltransferase